MTTDYPIVLYLNGKYCKTTNDVLACLDKASNVGSPEGKEILEAYANGTLKKWLELHAGNGVVEQFQVIENTRHDSDSALMNDLQKVFGIKNKQTLKPKFSDFVLVRNCDSNSYYGKNSQYENRVIRLNPRHDRQFSLAFVFNMEKSIHEKYELSLKESNGGNGEWKTLATKVIDTSTWTKGDDTKITFAGLQCNQLEKNTFDIALFVDNSDVVWTGHVVVGKDVALILDGQVRFNMLYVPGDSSVNSFYMGETVITNDIAGCLRGIEFGKRNRPYTKRANYNSFRDLVLNPLTNKFGICFRLPSKTEWCYAASWGNHSSEINFAGNLSVEKLAWFGCDSIHDVKLKEPNALGFYDMNGNVWEMVEYGQDYCGGAYNSNIEELKLSFSKSDIPKNNCDNNTGFRIVCSVEDIEKLLSTQRGVLIDEISLREENDYSLEDEVLRKKTEEVDLLEIE